MNLEVIKQLLPGGLDKTSLLSENYVVFDFETTNIDFGDCRDPDNFIVNVGYIWYKDGVVVDEGVLRGNEIELAHSPFADAIEGADLCVAHNAKFEYGWLRRMGIDISNILFFCTQIAEYVIAGNRPWRLSLDKIAQRRLGDHKDSLVSLMIKSGINPADIPAEYLDRYCMQDVRLTHEIFKLQKEELLNLNLMGVMYTRMVFTPVIVDIESRGMHLDKDSVIEETIKHEQQLREIDSQLEAIAGGVNWNSPKQVAELLYERLGFDELKDRRGVPIRTEADGRKTDSATIAKLKANNLSQRRFLGIFKERSKVNAALVKNLRFFRGVVEETDDCIFYANLNQTVTKTHRLSSTSKSVKFSMFDKAKGVQMQNIPREFKKLFTAREKGWGIGEVDGAQLEFRVAVFLGQDQKGIDDIVSGTDVHQFTADTLTRAGQETSRQDAKSRTFKPLYGGESGTKAEREYFKAFKEKYGGITNTQERWKDEVERKKMLVTATGLRFYWPDTRWEGTARNPYLRNTTSICNFPVQSFATADIIPISVTILHYLMQLHNLRSFIVNTIHDSSIMEVHPNEVVKLADLAEWSFNQGTKLFLKEVYDIDFNVPLESEPKIGSYWGSNDMLESQQENYNYANRG